MQASLVLDIIQRGRPCPHVLPASLMMQCGCGSTVDHSTRTHQGTLHEGSSVLQCKLPCCRAFSDALASDKRPRRPRTHSPAHLKIIVCPSDVAKRMALPCDAPEVLSMAPAPHDSPPKRHRARWPGRLSRSQTAASARGPRQAFLLPACPRKSQSSRNR